MRILIISPPRSGSSNLMHGLGFVLNYETISEPFNREVRVNTLYQWPFELPKNVVVKIISNEKSNNYKSRIEFLDDFIENFDKIILLSRRNTQEHFESYLNLRNKLGKGVGVAHSPWVKDELKNFKHNFTYDVHLKHYVDKVNELNEKLNIPITYYEDLYSHDRNLSKSIIKNFNIECDVEKLNNFLHPKFRYRQEKKLL